VAPVTLRSAQVTITFTSSNLEEGTVPVSIAFTSANWTTAQTVTVTGVDDNVDDGNVACTIVTAVQSSDPVYAAINPADVQVTNTDNDLTVAILGAPASNLAGTAIALTNSVSDVGSATSFNYYSGQEDGHTSPKRQRGDRHPAVSGPRAGAWGLCGSFVPG
jgi:hypothetical protein